MEGTLEEQPQVAENIAEEDAAPGYAEQATASDGPSAEPEHGAVESEPAAVDADATEAQAVTADLEGAAPAPEAADDAEGAKDGGEPPSEGVDLAPEGEAAAREAEGGVEGGVEGEPAAEGTSAEAEAAGEAAEGAPAADGEAAADGGEGGEALPAEEAAPPPPPEPPYVPPEVGEDYIPVAQLPPLPEPYGTNEEGKKVPLEGVQSIFLTGTTVEIVGLAHVGEGEGKDGSTSAYVSKEAILGDVQFRGAISDFYAIKQQILDADVDPLLLRINEDDVYGDGNNWQIVLSAEAGKTWEFIESETARRRQLAVDERLREQIERMKPRSQKARKATLWVSRGSEMEIEDMQVMARREPVTVILQRPRRAFNAPASLSDKDATELWNSSQMECRPFKDPNFDLRRMEQDVSVQAVPPTTDAGAQAGCTSWRPRVAQCEPRQLDAAAKAELCHSRKMRKFLERVACEFELALIENEITNVFEDDFAALADEDAVSGNRKEAIISELQSFTHLTYSKNMVVSAIEWLPHRKGVVAVSCTEAMGHQERVTRMGRPSNAYILIWNFRDPIHPEFVLQAPNEVFAFQFNPANPDVIAAGCYNGQVVLWDLSGEHERIAAVRASTVSSADHGGGGGGEGGDGDAHIAIVKWRYASAVEFSHHHVVADLAWLPGVDATRGKFVPLPDGPKECHFLATTGGDGKVNFWDIRMDKLMKKGRNKGGDDDLVWKPCHSLHIVSLLGMDLSGSRFCFNAKQLERGAFCIGSFDGEIVNGNYLRPDSSGENESTDCTRSIVQAHVGPVVALQRSPFYDDVMLSVGDWSFQIWREGEMTPLFASGYAGEYYTGGCWSPSRPAVVYLIDQAGNLEVWDMLDRSHEPSIRVTLSSSAFMSIAFMHGDGAGQQANLLALGDSTGVLRIVELPRNLRRAVPNESKLMAAFLEREDTRVADIASRAPLRQKVAKAAEEAKKAEEEAAARAAADAKDAKDAGGKDQANTRAAAAAAAAAVDAKAEQEYYKMEHMFKVKLGLVEGEEDGA